MSSRNPSTSFWISGAISLARRTVKSLVSMRRNRLCSGSSVRGKITAASLSSPVGVMASGMVLALNPRIGQRSPNILVAAGHPCRLAKEQVHRLAQPRPLAPVRELGWWGKWAVRGAGGRHRRQVSAGGGGTRHGLSSLLGVSGSWLSVYRASGGRCASQRSATRARPEIEAGFVASGKDHYVWSYAGDAESVKNGEPIRFVTEKQDPLAIFNVDGEFLCTSDTCTHEASSLVRWVHRWRHGGVCISLRQILTADRCSPVSAGDSATQNFPRESCGWKDIRRYLRTAVRMSSDHSG